MVIGGKTSGSGIVSNDVGVIYECLGIVKTGGLVDVGDIVDTGGLVDGGLVDTGVVV